MSGLRPHGPEGSCRACPVTCDRLVYPAGCVASGCDRLYAYEEGGRTVVGCLEKVFGPEIDLARLEEAERYAPGFGGLRALRAPLPMCSCAVDRTFAHRESACCNPGFLDGFPEHLLGARPDPAGAREK